MPKTSKAPPKRARTVTEGSSGKAPVPRKPRVEKVAKKTPAPEPMQACTIPDVPEHVEEKAVAPSPAPPAPVKVEPPKRTRIIKQACEGLLLEITGTTTEGHTTGHAYEEILRRVRIEFPSCNTSIKCLRWYATHMKEQGCRMPQKRDRPAPRPRQQADQPVAEAA